MEKTYRQITYKLRVHRGPGKPALESARPFRNVKGSRVYTDSDEAPTLVTFDEYCQVNIPDLLNMGAIAEYKPPKTAKKEVPSGKDGGKSD